jgi:hypothetical protein
MRLLLFVCTVRALLWAVCSSLCFLLLLLPAGALPMPRRVLALSPSGVLHVVMWRTYAVMWRTYAVMWRSLQGTLHQMFHRVAI